MDLNNVRLEGVRPRTARSAVFRLDSKGTGVGARSLFLGRALPATGVDAPIENEETMNQDDEDRLRDEYDFSGGVRGKHRRAYHQGSNVVLPEVGVAETSKHPMAGNEALPSAEQATRSNARKVRNG